MTLPDDLIDRAEGQLMRRVRNYSEAAVVPIDPVAIASAAATSSRAGRRGSGLFGRFSSRLVLAGATAAVLVIGLVSVLVPGAQPTATPNPSGAVPTLDAFGLPGDACPINKLGAAISTWDGAAGSRIAHVALTNFGQTACAIPSVVQVELVDATRMPLLSGKAMTHWTWVQIGAGQILTTLVDASNYCGAPAEEPVSLDFAFPIGAHVHATPASDPSSDSGVPPCNGAGQPAHIEMQPWTAAGGGAVPTANVPSTGPDAERTCTFRDGDAVITQWSGAAGSRVATVELRQLGPNACFVNSLPQVNLVGMVGGSITVMISGAPESGSPIDFKPGDLLYTQVDVTNYCGPDPEAPVTVAFGRDMADVNGFTATPLSPTDLSGVPPCNGPSRPAEIEMHPWSSQAP
jgi:hypothetical protein